MINNALVETFNVNNLNELTTITNNGTLTVAGTTTVPAASVTVNGLTANHYADATFSKDGFAVVNGNNTFTAIGVDSAGNSATNSITVNLPTTNSFVYDLNGNLLTNGNEVSVWNDENELVTNFVPGSWKSEFVYDGLWRRRIERDYSWNGSAWTQTNETHYIYDGNVIIQTRDGSNNPLLTFTRGNDLSGNLQAAGGIGGLLAMTESSGASSYYHADGAGNIVSLINTNQQMVAQAEYEPFGNFLSLSGPKAYVNPFWYSSKPVHWQSGKYDYLYRWYVPDLARWANRDPIQEWGGVNLYEFVRNNPVKFVDLLGLAYGNPISGPNGPVGPSTPGAGEFPIQNPNPGLLPSPNQVPPGYNSSWPTGIGDPNAGERPSPYVQDPNTGRKYWPDPETPRQWPHYNWRDPNGKEGHYPEKCDKTWPNQQKPPFDYQSPKNPWPEPAPEPTTEPTPTAPMVEPTPTEPTLPDPELPEFPFFDI